MIDLITNNFANIGVAVVVIWKAIETIKSNSSDLTKKIITDYKTRNEQLEEILKDEREKSEEFTGKMNKVVEDYKVEIAKLQAANDEKDKHNMELKAILQDKNPEVVIVLKEIRDFLATTDKQNKEVLGYQTTILEEWRGWSKNIDKDSKEHTGTLARVPVEA